MNQKKIVENESGKSPEVEEEQVKKKAGKDQTPPEKQDEDQDEDIDPETGRPRMRW